MAFLIVFLMFVVPCGVSWFEARKSATTRKYARNYSLAAIGASVGALILLVGAALKLAWPS